MNQEFLYLFHSTLGTVRLRKRLEQHDQSFRVCDVPRLLSAGCGLAIRLHCPPDEWQQWCQSGETAAVFRCEADGDYQELARYPADSPDIAKQTPVVGSRSHG